MNSEAKKTVNKDWKNQVEKEKKEAHEHSATYHEPSFTVFISSLTMQAMIALGRLKNPLTDNTEKNMDHARYLIDTISILKEKTQGNVTPQEENLLSESLYNLRMIYVEERSNK